LRQALSHAIEHESLPAVQALLASKANPNECGQETPLTTAARVGNVGIINALLEAGAEVNNSNNKKMKPLDVAAHYNRPEALTLLLDKGADTDKNDTALHLAVNSRCFPAVRILVESDASFLKKKDSHGFTPLLRVLQDKQKDWNWRDKENLDEEYNLLQRAEIIAYLQKEEPLIMERIATKYSTIHSALSALILASISQVILEYLYDPTIQDEVLKNLSLKSQSSNPLICLQRKISPDLDLKATVIPSPPLLIWTKAPAVSFQFLDLNVPPVSSDLVGHKPINCGRMLRKDIDI
jgi:ankyrin repeat protein